MKKQVRIRSLTAGRPFAESQEQESSSGPAVASLVGRSLCVLDESHSSWWEGVILPEPTFTEPTATEQIVGVSFKTRLVDLLL